MAVRGLYLHVCEAIAQFPVINDGLFTDHDILLLLYAGATMLKFSRSVDIPYPCWLVNEILGLGQASQFSYGTSGVLTKSSSSLNATELLIDLVCHSIMRSIAAIAPEDVVCGERQRRTLGVSEGASTPASEFFLSGSLHAGWRGDDSEKIM